jgi:NAD(P)-dependent dehydrogenase (short-subunit alcohol dehydrogenase family)
LLSISPNNHVLLGSRSVEKGEAAVKELQFRNQSSSIVEFLQIDVASESSIQQAAKQVKERYGRYVIPRSNLLSAH